MNLQVIETKTLENLIALSLEQLSTFVTSYPFSVQDVTGTGTHFGAFASCELADEELHRLEDAEIVRIEGLYPQLSEQDFATAAIVSGPECITGNPYPMRFARACAVLAMDKEARESWT